MRREPEGGWKKRGGRQEGSEGARSDIGDIRRMGGKEGRKGWGEEERRGGGLDTAGEGRRGVKGGRRATTIKAKGR